MPGLEAYTSDAKTSLAITVRALVVAALLAGASTLARADDMSIIESPRLEAEPRSAPARDGSTVGKANAEPEAGLFRISTSAGAALIVPIGLGLVAAFGLSVILLGWAGGWNATSRND